MNFGFSIDPRGLGVMRDETLFNVGVQGRRFDGFGDHDGNGIDRVFRKRLIGLGT